MGNFNKLVDHIFELSVVPAQSYARILEGAEIIRAAQEEARQIIENAKQIYEQKRIQAYNEAQSNFNNECIEKSIDLSVVILKSIKNIEKRILETVVHCIQKIIADYIPNKALSSLIKKAIKCIQNENKVVIKMNKEQILSSQDVLQEVVRDFPDMVMDIVEDNTIAIGDCIVSTKFCLIHTGINHYLKLLQKKAQRINQCS